MTLIKVIIDPKNGIRSNFPIRIEIYYIKNRYTIKHKLIYITNYFLII